MKGAGPIVVIAGTLGIGLRPMNAKDSEAGAFRAIMGSNLDRTHGFMKYTVTADRIQAQFVATTPGELRRPVHDRRPEPPADPGRRLSTLSDLPRRSPPTTAPPAATGPDWRRRRGRDPGSGYWMLGADGAVYPFGEAASFGSRGRACRALRRRHRTHPVGAAATGSSTTPARSAPFGDATAYGGVSRAVLAHGRAPDEPLGHTDRQGYWVFTNRGRVVAFGDARFLGDVSGTPSTARCSTRSPPRAATATTWWRPTAGSSPSATPRFAGSMGGTDAQRSRSSRLVPDADGDGYWLVASDGGIFAFDAPFRGSMGGTALGQAGDRAWSATATAT